MPSPEFVTVAHPDLPGQTARMVNPRNGWEPVTKKTTAKKAAKDSPAAGQSTTTPEGA